ncbi:hypothetical protein GF339_09350 [candidate division KSB3 bacterium]|uniref:PIN domain-containing protein n=1 Tax=candidate division KSB3 bacterium TaxID=2044937 RepID=A0A9D5Q5W4_9BACT|nr:hypothetical protein [candidate division KSB3 bacterium]
MNIYRKNTNEMLGRYQRHPRHCSGTRVIVEQAALFLQMAPQQSIHLFITATTVTDLYYITRKEKGKETALAFLEDLLQFVDVASVDKHVIRQALHSEMPDFEDAIQAYSARQETITIIVTRNEKDFEQSGLDVYSPSSFLQSLQQANG